MGSLESRWLTLRTELEAIVAALVRDGYVFLHPARALVPPASDVATTIAAIEARLTVPPALRSLWSTLGSCDLAGTHPAWPRTACLALPGSVEPSGGALMSDPLVLFSPAQALEIIDDFEIDDSIPIAPDAHAKAGYGGGDFCSIAAGDPGADPILHGPRPATTLIAYVERSIREGGFPGLAGG
jgi:hypothetical protein